MRGLAALQVVFLHYTAALFPLAAGVSGASHTDFDAAFRFSPFFFLIDGYSAVYLFFLISGFVLGPAFSKGTIPLPRLAVSRVIRLIVPVIVSAPFAVLGLFAWRQWGAEVLSQTGSQWLASLVLAPFDPLVIGRDIVLNGTLLGYRGTSVFGDADWLTPINVALNPPLWTLAYEVWGSLLLILLCALPLAPLWRGAVAILLILFVTGSGELSLFLIGYVTSLLRLPETGAKTAHRIVSAALIAVGGYFAITKEFPQLQELDAYWSQVTLLSAQSEFHLASSFGAILVFLGVWLNPWARRMLAAPALRALGRLSFSFYLLHFPLMLLIGLPATLLLTTVAPYGVSAIVGTFVGITATIALSSLFYRVDRYALELARFFRSPKQFS